MPTLKQITCSIELGCGNVPLPEYMVKYRDGSVLCLIATPDDLNLTFSIHIIAAGFIAPGLACTVFIDGERHCNRNAPCEPSRSAGTQSPSQAKTEFRLRQHEEPISDGNFIGREWEFGKLTRADYQIANNDSFESRVGTIEVVILRCQYEELTSAPRRIADAGYAKAGKKAAAQQKGDGSGGQKRDGGKQNGSTPKKNAKTVEVLSSKKARSDITVSSASLGSFFGHDGATDDDLWAASNDELEHTESLSFKDQELYSCSEAEDCEGSPSTLISAADQKTLERKYILQTGLHLAQYDGPNDSSAPSLSVKSNMKDTNNGIFAQQPYWKAAVDSRAGRHTDTGSRQRERRTTLTHPALPERQISVESKAKSDRYVRAIEGALYAHNTRRPQYIDDIESPYAVFTFRYMSRKQLEKYAGIKIGRELDVATDKALEEHLKYLPKDDLVEEVMYYRRNQQLLSSSAKAPTVVVNDWSANKSDRQESAQVVPVWDTSGMQNTQDNNDKQDTKAPSNSASRAKTPSKASDGKPPVLLFANPDVEGDRKSDGGGFIPVTTNGPGW